MAEDNVELQLQPFPVFVEQLELKRRCIELVVPKRFMAGDG
jgi:hypothetical protein